jgi:hypothetical protein
LPERRTRHQIQHGKVDKFELCRFQIQTLPKTGQRKSFSVSEKS